ncbi:hypothetical protein [Microbulbifer thermotolerans]|uniref:hypothetical protein n=1 Tax=Microbulbifer thermotolerans TaxID=252514 RepID=UPI0022489928|nr:hypothetical protein [Microbulbifer thermotolerans]MCX2831894.1 hypothetical protein [Microbulbifer thermotolerans]
MSQDAILKFLKENPSSINFDINKLNDYVYVTNNLFNHAARKGSSDEQFSLLLKILNNANSENPLLGGIITNLCYRYNEKLEERDFIFPYIYEIKDNYDNVVDITKPAYSRWLVSSSNTLGTVALMRGEVERGKKILERGLKIYSLAAHTPLLYLNLCMMYFQYAMIRFQEGRVNHAASIFEKCYYLSISAINEIYSSRNDYILSMKFDCDRLTKIGLEALKANSFLLRDKSLFGSRIPKVNVDTNFDVSVITARFARPSSSWHKNIEKKINEVQL